MTVRELDKEVARQIMGFDVSALVSLSVPCPDRVQDCFVRHFDLHFPNGMPLPHYSSDLMAAWQVVIEVSANTRWWQLNLNGNGVRANFTGDPKDDAFGMTVEEAICLAALKMERNEEKAEDEISRL